MIYLIGLCSVNSQYFVEQLDSSASETHKEEFDIFCSEIQNILQNAVSRSIQWTVIMKGCRRGKQCWELAGAIVNTGIDTNGLEHKIGQSLSGINFLWLLHVWCSFIINKRQHLCVFVCLFWVFFSSFFWRGDLGNDIVLQFCIAKNDNIEQRIVVFLVATVIHFYGAFCSAI